MRGVISVTGRAAALSRQQPMRSAGRRRPWPSGMLLHHARSVAAPAVAGRAAACLATAAAIILTGASAAPAGALAGGWSVTPSPNPRVPTGQLFWVSCPTADSCMAVGTYVKTSGEGVNLAEQWNGTSWRILPTPNPSGIALSGLFGVTCTAPSACTAVGASTTTTGAVRAVAERWNGGTWSLQPTPTPAGGGALNSVSCTSPSACTAVGGRADGTTLAERWNGTRWSIQPTPNPSQGGATLSGVSCTSASACTAVGGSNAFTPNARTLAERWNGTSWSIQPTPNPAQGGGFLASVACPTSSGCTAVGASNAGTLAEGWNGTSWSIQPTPTPAGAQFAFLNSVSCTSSSACTAAGTYFNSSGTPQTLAEHWNGASLHRRRVLQHQPVPGGPGGAVGRHHVAHPGRAQSAGGGIELPQQRVVHLALGLRHGRVHHHKIANCGHAGGTVEWPHLAHSAHPEPSARRCPERRVVHPALGVHRRRGHRERKNPRRAADRREVAHPGHPQPCGRRLPEQRVVCHAFGLYGGWELGERQNPGRAVERDQVEHPAHSYPCRGPVCHPVQRGLHLTVGLHGGWHPLRQLGQRGRDAGRGLERQSLADRADARAHRARHHPQRRILHLLIGLHRRRQFRNSNDLGRTVERHELARSANPQPAWRPRHLPHQRGLPHILGLHRIRAHPHRLGTPHPGRTVERPHLAHPANSRTRNVRHRHARRSLPYVIGLLRRRELHQQRPEPDPGRAMEPHNGREPADHQPPSSTGRLGPRVHAPPAQHGRI